LLISLIDYISDARPQGCTDLQSPVTCLAHRYCVRYSVQFDYLFIAWQCGRGLTWKGRIFLVMRSYATASQSRTTLLQPSFNSLGTSAAKSGYLDVLFSLFRLHHTRKKHWALCTCVPLRDCAEYKTRAWAHQLPSWGTWMCCSHCFGCTTSERSVGYCALECL